MTLTSPSRRGTSLLSRPIRSVEELLLTDFTADPSPLHRTRRKWTGCLEETNKLQTLVCHDMRGGYGDDANPQGIIAKGGNGYAPWFWPLVDIFVYFSHSRVTIPPLGWIEICHRNDIPCLGTLIFEWDAGSNDLKKLLKNVELGVQQLVSAMVHFGFDGYLLNFECELGNANTPDQLIDFISLLVTAAHEAVPWSKIIYYDGIDSEGHLAYQCHLNNANLAFFKAADGILIDYHWKPEHPLLSFQNAGHRSKQVFMGIDVFGRGTFGGGGYNMASAIRYCFQAGVSVGIFAPGWAYESAGGFSKGREACLRIEARIWTEAPYTVIQPTPNAWEPVRSHDSVLYERSQAVALLDIWDGAQVNPCLLDSIPPISVFHREGSRLQVDFLTDEDDTVGTTSISLNSNGTSIEGFVGYGKGIRKLLWKEQSSVQHDEIPAVWISRPPLADRSPILKPQPIKFKLPFLNNFSQGCGKSVYKSGKRISDKPWYQLLQQDVPALFLFNSDLFPDSRSSVRVSWDRSQAFEAGNCICCELEKFSNAKIPLFQFNSNGQGTAKKLLRMSVSVMPGSAMSYQTLGVSFDDKSCLSLVLECDFWKDWLSKFSWLSDAEKGKVQELAEFAFPDCNMLEADLHEIDLGAIAHEFSIWRAGKVFPKAIIKHESEWITFKFELNVSPLTSVEWQVRTGESHSNFRLGQIVIAEHWRPPPNINQLTVHETLVDGEKSVILKWSETGIEETAWYDIFVQNSWIGRSFTNMFVIDRSTLASFPSSNRKIFIQANGLNGSSIPLKAATIADLEPLSMDN